MDRDRHRRVKEIVHEAARHGGVERVRLVERACGDDVALRREVESLLRFDDASDDPFGETALRGSRRRIDGLIGGNAPGSSGGATTVDSQDLADGDEHLAPTRIGDYHILGLIGQGGMGRVYLAEQEQPRRRVAVKILRHALAGERLRQRFSFEASVLGRLEHAGIARIYEAGTADVLGQAQPPVVLAARQPFIAMEFIQGQPLDCFAQRTALSIPARLQLFVQICQAVNYAHTKAVIHRDLKPGNILVTADGSPKILDFGIARVVEDTDGPVTTIAGQPIGTPSYMSPEQTEGSPDIDTRTDVYALGVVLYELLTGVTPFEPREPSSASFREMQRMIRETDARRPSTMISAESAVAMGLAGAGATDWRKLRAMVQGELDWIVMRALEKDRARRYQSAGEFAADIGRFLAGEAVVAAPPSRRYLIGKLLRRHKGLVAATAAVAASLLIGAIAFAWQARAASLQRDKAERIAEFMGDLLEGVGPGVARGRDTVMLREMVDNAAGRIKRGELKDAPEAELQLRMTIGKAYRELSLFAESAELLEPAVPLARVIHPGPSAELADALHSLAGLEKDRGALDRAQTHVQEAIDIQRQLYPGGDHALALSVNTLGCVQLARSETNAAATTLQEALAIFRRVSPPDDNDTADCLLNLGVAHYNAAEYAESEKHFLAAREMYARLFPGDHPRHPTVLTQIGALRMAQGDFADAERCLEAALAMRKRMLPDGHIDIASVQNILGMLCFNRGDYARAEALFREALGTYERAHAGDHNDTALMLNNIAACSFFQRDLAEAETLYQRSAEMTKRLNPNSVLPVSSALTNLAHLRLTRKDLAGADRTVSELIEMLRREFPDGHPQTAGALSMRAIVLVEARDFELAEQCHREAIELWRRLPSDSDLKLAGGLANYAFLLERRGDYAQAESLSREAIATYQRLNAADQWLAGFARMRLGRALTEQSRFTEAEPELIEAEKILSTAQGAPAARREDCARGLALLYEKWHQADPHPDRESKAVQWRTKLDEYASSPPASP